MAEVKLERTLSSLQITAVAFGFMVAASTWAVVAGAFGVYGFGFIWTALIGGAIFVILALTYGELAVTFPKAASFQIWGKVSLGSFFGMFMGVFLFGVYVAGPAVDSTVLGQVIQYITGVNWQWWTLITLTIALALNLFGIRVAGISEVIMMIIMLACFGGIGVLAISGISLNSVEIDWSSMHMPFGVTGIFAALVLAYYLFWGFEAALPLVEETKAPEKVPMAIVYGIILAMAVKIMFGVGGLYVISMKELGELGRVWYPHVVIAERVIGSTPGRVLMFILAWVASISSMVAVYAAASRVFYGMAESKPHNYMPKFFGYLHPRYRTPWVALFLMYGCHLVYIMGIVGNWGLGGLFFMFGTVIMLWNFQYVLVSYAYLTIHFKHPDIKRPFKVYAGPVLSIIAIVTVGIAIYLTSFPPFGSRGGFYGGLAWIAGIAVFCIIWHSVKGIKMGLAGAEEEIALAQKE
jgi:amino acid transporter